MSCKYIYNKVPMTHIHLCHEKSFHNQPSSKKDFSLKHVNRCETNDFSFSLYVQLSLVNISKNTDS